MTTDLCAYWAGTKPATGPTEDVGWVILVVILVIIALISSAVSVAVWRQWRQVNADEGLPLLSPGAWGKPDLAPPSNSPEALAEVAELEALWRQSGRRRRSASSD